MKEKNKKINKRQSIRYNIKNEQDDKYENPDE